MSILFCMQVLQDCTVAWLNGTGNGSTFIKANKTKKYIVKYLCEESKGEILMEMLFQQYDRVGPQYWRK